MRKTLFLLLLAIVMPTVATADAGRAVYNLGEGTHDWGTGDSRNETYNVALRIADEAFVGCRVTGVRIWFTTVEGLSATRAWLSKELTVKSTKFAGPDVETVDFDAVDGYNEVSFSHPYTITSEGIYVGYSVLAAKDVNMAPIRLTDGGSADGLFVHTSGLYRGHFYTFDGEKGALAIEVMLEGDVLQNAVRVGSVASDYMLTGDLDSAFPYLKDMYNNAMSVETCDMLLIFNALYQGDDQEIKDELSALVKEIEQTYQSYNVTSLSDTTAIINGKKTLEDVFLSGTFALENDEATAAAEASEAASAEAETAE